MNCNRVIQLILISFFIVISGCFDSSLTVQLRYDQVVGLKKGDNVYFNKNKVGLVDNIIYTADGDYLVEISIEKEFNNAATKDSSFYIEDDPTELNSKAVAIYQERAGGEVLQKDVVVEGSVRVGVIEELIRQFEANADLAEGEITSFVQQLKESLEAASRKLDYELETALIDLFIQLDKYEEKIKKVPDSEEVKQLEQSLQQLAEEFLNAQQDVRDYMQNVILPKLQKEFDQLKERLEKEGREEEIEGIEQQMKEMTIV